MYKRVLPFLWRGKPLYFFPVLPNPPRSGPSRCASSTKRTFGIFFMIRNWHTRSLKLIVVLVRHLPVQVYGKPAQPKGGSVSLALRLQPHGAVQAGYLREKDLRRLYRRGQGICLDRRRTGRIGGHRYGQKLRQQLRLPRLPRQGSRFHVHLCKEQRRGLGRH